MTTTVRLKKLINAIETWGNDYCYFDEDKGETVMVEGMTPDDLYEDIMKDDELHFLGKECVKQWVDTWWNNWELYEKLRMTLKLY